jgi:hypothetical protein
LPGLLAPSPLSFFPSASGEVEASPDVGAVPGGGALADGGDVG